MAEAYTFMDTAVKKTVASIDDRSLPARRALLS
jgi:hypothetical protein